MKDEIIQNGKSILSSEDGNSIAMIFNNLIGKNIKGAEYLDYLKNVAFEKGGFKPGEVMHCRDGVVVRKGIIPQF